MIIMTLGFMIIMMVMMTVVILWIGMDFNDDDYVDGDDDFCNYVD